MYYFFLIKSNFRILLIFILILLVPLISFTQELKNIDVKGKVQFNKEPLSEAVVELFLDTVKVSTIKTSAEGKFNFTLLINNQYMIKASKADFVPKKILFNSKVTSKDFNNKYQFIIDLFKIEEGINLSAFDIPVAKISYNNEMEEFDYDEEYTESVQEKFADIMISIATAKKKKYDGVIAKADGFFRNKNYSEALVYYNNAIDIDSQYDYPKRRVIECKNFISKVDTKSQDYNKTISIADKFFDDQKYPEAKTSYEKALNIKPDEIYSKNKILKIDSILNVKAEQDKKMKLARDKAIVDSLAIVKAGNDKKAILKREKIVSDSLALVKADREKMLKLKREQAIADSLSKSKAEKEKLAKITRDKAISDSLALVKADREKMLKLKREQAIADSISKSKAEKEKLAKITRDKAISDSLALVKAGKDKTAKAKREKAVSDSLALVKADREKMLKLKREQAIADSLSKAKAEKEKLADLAKEKVVADSLASLKSSDKKDEHPLAELDDFKNKQKEKKILSDLAKKYPEGMTVERYVINGEKVRRIIIVKDGDATEYRQITHSWGGNNYYKNGQMITENVFFTETKE